MSRRATCMYRNVDFCIGTRGPADAIQYERSYRAEVARFARWHKEKPGYYHRKAEEAGWGMPHDKAKPGLYRQPYKRRNDYIRWQD